MKTARNELFLLSGPPGIGKTTAVRAISGCFEPSRQTGFYCHERLLEGKRNGFLIRLLSGEEGLLAAPEIKGNPRFGTMMPDGRRRLGVNCSFLTSVVCPIVSGRLGNADLVVIDEIGPMQAVSVEFRSMIASILSSDVITVASIAVSDDPWISEIRAHYRDCIYHLTASNRNETVTRICAEICRLGFPMKRSNGEGL